MAVPLPPASNLHAILLVTKSRSLGPSPRLSLSAAIAVSSRSRRGQRPSLTPLDVGARAETTTGETVLGFKTDALEKMLSPSKEYNKKRFELGVESIVFLGAPMFVREDGLWKKAKRKRKKRSGKQRLEDGDLMKNLTSASDDGDADSPEAPAKPVPEPFRMPEGFEPGYGHGSMSSGPSGAPSRGWIRRAE
ncbi:unnamed protein product [Alternaria alternata]